MAIGDYNHGLVILPQQAAPIPGEQVVVRDAAPPDFATKVRRSKSPRVSFGAPVEPSSVTESTVYLKNGRTGKKVSSTVMFDALSNRVTIDPMNTLAASTPYIVFVDGVGNTHGEPLPGPLTFRFVTRN